MPYFNARTCSPTNLKDKVFVISGGSTGIGAATVDYLASLGARVVFGDLNRAASESLVEKLKSPNVSFQQCDVRQYQEVVALFRYALSEHGRIDHAVANAGVIEQGNWFDKSLTIDSVEQEPNALVLDVNLKGLIYFSRVAAVYMAHDKSPGEDKTLTLLSSAAGFIESRNLFLYQCSKHGVLGLLRTCRLAFPDAMKGVRVNALCPSFVRTTMTKDIAASWDAAGLPANEVEDLARAIAMLAAADSATAPGLLEVEKRSDGIVVNEMNSTGAMQWGVVEGQSGLTGRAFYLEGGVCWDIEEGLDRTRHLWLGEQPDGQIVKVQQLMRKVGYRERD
ncbi:hypothetical protein LTR10_011832 [Elasticomyces elasticus]|uniref:3-hydroxyacyl-CoA dehydrogenase n=1 Tax=Exophiala sideris TaxID=1016849 RepID=A0ABR0JDL8_9EURO|nr:hypothetical protein LTR10_011832 [Elasticomyces elasticus]KAK5031711.1 hypothetical protein LTS07_004331 [Exophiala sideris]KAK5040640.1 hypothetical protein LTR13_002940 [Exophiala sideris]KAK5062026.1 hypothetical protein LTR69_005210 [Exophiala sideris]KAK5184726.1 hypothetical protein LTR44_003401 [Eurotiomycetes sp. CCFEE 6388]